MVNSIAANGKTKALLGRNCTPDYQETNKRYAYANDNTGDETLPKDLGSNPHSVAKYAAHLALKRKRRVARVSTFIALVFSV
jgi:hypothetical protein